MKPRVPNLRALVLMIVVLRVTSALAQITPSGDAYIDSTKPTINFGAAVTLGVVSPSQTTFIAFDLSSIPSGYTGSSIAKATLKLYVSSVTKEGSFNVDLVNGSWTESTLTANNAPALGATIAASVPLTKSQARHYILIDITQALQDWLNGTPNDGIALVANSPFAATFESKENIKESHNAELDVVFAGGNGAITGITTDVGSGLTGGGTSGTLNLSLLTSCSSGQTLSWNGSVWGCANAGGTGTVTSVGSGLGLTGGPITTNGTLSIDPTVIPQLAASNLFANQNEFSANLPGGMVLGVVNSGPGPALYAQGGTYGGQFYGGSSGAGVYAENDTDADFNAASIGVEKGTTKETLGVYGSTASPSGAGVYGVGVNASAIANTYPPIFGTGVWADTGQTLGQALYATADKAQAVTGINNSSQDITAYFHNYGGGGNCCVPVLHVGGNHGACAMDSGGNMACTGNKAAVVPVDGGSRKVALYGVQSPENWFEDAGSGQLSNGEATVNLEASFGQTVNTQTDYHVFLTPSGDCKGLYVAQKSATSFVVRELGSGTSNVVFDYRIMARRKGYENVRLEDKTAMFEGPDKFIPRAQPVSRPQNLQEVLRPVPMPHRVGLPIKQALPPILKK